MTDEAFSRAARTYGDTLFRVAYHALQNRADAEDVMQTVLLRLYESRKEFESEAHLKHWLLRVAVNCANSFHVKLGRRRTEPLSEALSVPAPEGEDLWEELRRLPVSLDEQRDEAAPEDSAQREVFEAVMALEPKYRLTVYLYYYEGCSVREVADALRANPSTVQTWLLRARTRLRKELAQGEEKEESDYVRSQIVP